MLSFTPSLQLEKALEAVQVGIGLLAQDLRQLN